MNHSLLKVSYFISAIHGKYHCIITAKPNTDNDGFYIHNNNSAGVKQLPSKCGNMPYLLFIGGKLV